ncbi:hypothetical protein [Methylomusa anaerophila]|nr:hypothetical protein [Methylomusa anaerophila]
MKGRLCLPTLSSLKTIAFHDYINRKRRIGLPLSSLAGHLIGVAIG